MASTAPVFLSGEPPSLTEEPGRPQVTGLERVRPNRSNPAHIDTRLFFFFFFFFAYGSSAPLKVEHEVNVAAWLVGTLASQVCRDTDCLHCGRYGPLRVFFQASCSWQSEGLFGQSFFVAPPIQTERAPFPGVLLCRSACRSLEGHLGGVLLCSSVSHVFGGSASLLFSC